METPERHLDYYFYISIISESSDPPAEWIARTQQKIEGILKQFGYFDCVTRYGMDEDIPPSIPRAFFTVNLSISEERYWKDFRSDRTSMVAAIRKMGGSFYYSGREYLEKDTL